MGWRERPLVFASLTRCDRSADVSQLTNTIGDRADVLATDFTSVTWIEAGHDRMAGSANVGENSQPQDSMGGPFPPTSDVVVTGAEHRQERLLRDFDFAELLHPFLAFFLLSQQFAFAGDVAAVAFGGHVLSAGRRSFRGR